MALQILTEPPEALVAKIKAAIEAAIANAEATVRLVSPGHFEISVTAAAFEGLSRVKQHQQVYAAVTPFMSGDNAPVHAIDQLETKLP